MLKIKASKKRKKTAKFWEVGNMENKKKNIVIYQNDLIDKFIFEYKQKEIDLFFGIILQAQQNSTIVEFQKDEIRKLIKTGNLSNEEFTKLIRGLASKNIRYKTQENIIDTETGEILAESGDFVTMNFFDLLVEAKNDIIKIKIKKEFHKYIFEIKKELGFSTHNLQKVLQLDSRYEKLLFVLLNRWKNFQRPMKFDFEYFKKYLNIPKSYKNNDVKRLLEKAQQNIKKSTGIRFEFQFIKKGQKVLTIEFVMSDVVKDMIKKVLNPDTNEFEKKVLKIGLKNMGIENPEVYDLED